MDSAQARERERLIEQTRQALWRLDFDTLEFIADFVQIGLTVKQPSVTMRREVVKVDGDPQDDWLEALKDVKVVFWVCPDGHSEHSYRDPPRETVRWIDGIAHCMTPGCERTSAGSRE